MPVEGEIGWCVLADLGKACTDDGECGGELLCVKGSVAIDCAPDAPDCGSSSDPDQGFCEYPPPEPLKCDADDHCAPPLACDTASEEPLCYYPDLSCSDDADCADGFECVAGADFAGECAQCADDGSGGEPLCEPVPCDPPPDQCFPALVACSDDADCPDEWSCRELTLDFVAPQWPESALGSMGCVPGGTLQLYEGNYYLGGYQAADGQILEAIPLSASGAAADEDTATASMDGDPGREPHSPEMMSAHGSSGCSATGRRGGALDAGCVLALAGLALARRRKSAQPR